jgi:hypothetical protein
VWLARGTQRHRSQPGGSNRFQQLWQHDKDYRATIGAARRMTIMQQQNIPGRKAPRQSP